MRRRLHRRRFLGTTLAAAGIVTAGCSGVLGGIGSGPTRFQPENGDNGDRFGNAVAATDDRILVSAAGDTDPAAGLEGSAYVYERDGDWSRTATLTPPSGTWREDFGHASAVSAGTALVCVGPDGAENEAGIVYVFDRNDGDWSRSGTLETPAGEENGDFGEAVDVDDGTAIVGASADGVGADLGTGAVYVYDRSESGWQQTARLSPEDLEQGDWFGESVAISGTTAIVGAWQQGRSDGVWPGSAYVFERVDGAWSRQTRLWGRERDGVEFGAAVAIDGDTAVVGARDALDENGVPTGAAYVFERQSTDWTQTARFLPENGTEDEWFGVSVDVAGDVILVGAYQADDNARNAGAAYVFERTDDGWTRDRTLGPQNGNEQEQFGWSVALTDDSAVVGAPGFLDGDGQYTGAAYVFDL